MRISGDGIILEVMVSVDEKQHYSNKYKGNSKTGRKKWSVYNTIRLQENVFCVAVVVRGSVVNSGHYLSLETEK